jgi:hypothetical protein
MELYHYQENQYLQMFHLLFCNALAFQIKHPIAFHYRKGKIFFEKIEGQN